MLLYQGALWFVWSISGGKTMEIELVVLRVEYQRIKLHLEGYSKEQKIKEC